VEKFALMYFLTHIFMINADVHQGSVLSLLLFSVLMNKLIDKLVAYGFSVVPKVNKLFNRCR